MMKAIPMSIVEQSINKREFESQLVALFAGVAVEADVRPEVRQQAVRALAELAVENLPISDEARSALDDVFAQPDLTRMERAEFIRLAQTVWMTMDSSDEPLL